MRGSTGSKNSDSRDGYAVRGYYALFEDPEEKGICIYSKGYYTNLFVLIVWPWSIMQSHEELYEERRQEHYSLSVDKEEEKDQLVFKWFKIKTNGNELIPTLFVHQTAGPSGKLLLFVHGFGGRKEDVTLFRQVAEPLGVSMLAIDARGHGDRQSAIADTPPQELLGLLSGSIVDNRIAIDMASQNGWVEQGKLILAGTSMGGILGGVIAGVDQRISGAALYVAGGDLVEILKRSKHPTVSQVVSGIPRFMFSLFKGQVANIDPINYIDRISPRPLLLQLGKNDEYVPFDCGIKLFDKAKEPKDLVVHDSGHDLPREKALSETINWIRKRFPTLFP